MKIIEIIVSPQGESRVQTKGFAGSECQQASRFLEQALGRSVRETLTGEFHGASLEQSRQIKEGH